MGQRVTEEWLYRWMPVVDEAMIHCLEQETDSRYGFSENFEDRMRRLAVRERRQPVRRAVTRFLAGAATLLLVFAGTFMAVTLSVDAYRQGFFVAVKNILENGRLTIDYSAEQSNFAAQAPEEFPKGYRVMAEVFGGSYYWVDCQNEAGKRICWNQMQVTDGMSLWFVTEYDSSRDFDVKGGSGTIYFYQNGCTRTYFEGDNYIVFLTADDLGGEEILGMFESMRQATEESLEGGDYE